MEDGHKCSYRKQWNKDKINDAVAEVIRKLVQNPKFEKAILEKMGERIDTAEVEMEKEALEKQHRQLIEAKNRIGQQIDALDTTDKYYKKIEGYGNRET